MWPQSRSLDPDGDLLTLYRPSAQRPQYIGSDILRDLDDGVALGNLYRSNRVASYSRLARDRTDEVSRPDAGAASDADVKADHAERATTSATLLPNGALLRCVA